MKTTFSNVAIGSHFDCNGNTWIKVSTRTARIVKPTEYAGKCFYFGKSENVTL